MLQFNRRQMASIGGQHIRTELQHFFARHFPQAEPPPPGTIEADIGATIEHCRSHGLRSQRAVALYALAAYVFGQETVRNDPGLNAILQAREQPAANRALLIEIWLTQAWGSLQRATRR